MSPPPTHPSLNHRLIISCCNTASSLTRVNWRQDRKQPWDPDLKRKMGLKWRLFLQRVLRTVAVERLSPDSVGSVNNNNLNWKSQRQSGCHLLLSGAIKCVCDNMCGLAALFVIIAGLIASVCVCVCVCLVFEMRKEGFLWCTVTRAAAGWTAGCGDFPPRVLSPRWGYQATSGDAAQMCRCDW